MRLQNKGQAQHLEMCSTIMNTIHMQQKDKKRFIIKVYVTNK